MVEDINNGHCVDAAGGQEHASSAPAQKYSRMLSNEGIHIITLYRCMSAMICMVFALS